MENKKIIDWYLEYVNVVVEALSSDVKYWITFNEPICFLMLGEMLGMMAPFHHHFLTFSRFIKVMLLAHGKAVKLIREVAKTKPEIGIVMAATAYVPFDESEKEIEKARKMTFDSLDGCSNNSQYTDPIILRKSRLFVKGQLSKKDLDIISAPIDFIGLNTYQPCNERMKDKRYPKKPKTYNGWTVDGRVLY